MSDGGYLEGVRRFYEREGYRPVKVVELLERAHRLGAHFSVPEPGRIHVKSPAPLPDGIMRALREYKDEVLALLDWSLSDVAGGREQCQACPCRGWWCDLSLVCQNCQGAMCVCCGGCLSDRYRVVPWLN